MSNRGAHTCLKEDQVISNRIKMGEILQSLLS